MDIFRGRYRDSIAKPSPIPAGKVQRYRFALPHANHVFLPGHRVMVQVRSSWFPLYDRNPQTYVENIFFAKPGDYRKGDAEGLPRRRQPQLHRTAGGGKALGKRKGRRVAASALSLSLSVSSGVLAAQEVGQRSMSSLPAWSPC